MSNSFNEAVAERTKRDIEARERARKKAPQRISERPRNVSKEKLDEMNDWLYAADKPGHTIHEDKPTDVEQKDPRTMTDEELAEFEQRVNRTQRFLYGTE
jgi:hypothetical protein